MKAKRGTEGKGERGEALAFIDQSGGGGGGASVKPGQRAKGRKVEGKEKTHPFLRVGMK